MQHLYNLIEATAGVVTVNKYKKWEALEKECAAEEQAELAAKKAERDRRKAERQQGRGVKGGSGDPIRDAYEQAFENKKGEMKITREVRFGACVPLRSGVLTIASACPYTGGAEVQKGLQRSEVSGAHERLYGGNIGPEAPEGEICPHLRGTRLTAPFLGTRSLPPPAGSGQQGARRQGVHEAEARVCGEDAESGGQVEDVRQYCACREGGSAHDAAL